MPVGVDHKPLIWMKLLIWMLLKPLMPVGVDHQLSDVEQSWLLPLLLKPLMPVGVDHCSDFINFTRL